MAGWVDNRAGCLVLILMDNFMAHGLAVELIKESDQPLKWAQIQWFPVDTAIVFKPTDQMIRHYLRIQQSPSEGILTRLEYYFKPIPMPG